MDLYFLNPTKETKVHNITSPRVDDQGVEDLIVAKGKTAPRITPEDVTENIASEWYFTALEGVSGYKWPDQEAAASGPLGLLTFCVLVLQNGFPVTGESACASPENFDADIGKRIARANAVSKIWPLMGYQLRSELAGGAGV